MKLSTSAEGIKVRQGGTQLTKMVKAKQKSRKAPIIN
jgi:hypothetical protein